MATAAEIWRRQIAEDHALIDARERADAVYRALSLPGAPEPFAGESLRSYQVRVLEKLKPYSPTWELADLRRLRDYSPSTLDVVESQVLVVIFRQMVPVGFHSPHQTGAPCEGRQGII